MNYEIDYEALADFIEGSGLRYKKGSVSYILDCPRCNKEKLYIYRSTKNGRFVCWVELAV